MPYCRRWIANRFAWLLVVVLGIAVLLPAPLPAQGAGEQMAIWTFDGAPEFLEGQPIDAKTDDVSGTPTLRLLNADVDPDGESGIGYTDAKNVSHEADRAAGWTDIAKSGANDADLRIALNTTGWQSLNLRLNYRSELATSYDLEYSFDEATWIKALDDVMLSVGGDFIAVLPASLPAAVANQPAVFLRIVDLDNGPGNGQFHVDNLEITGSRIDPTAPVIRVAAGSTPLLSLTPSGSGFASGVIGDPTDPAAVFGIDVVLSDTDTPLTDVTVTAASSNPAVVPNMTANLVLSGSAGTRNLTIIPTGVGFARIVITARDTTGKIGVYLLDYAASAAAPTPASSRFHSGISDASAAIAVDADTMLVANDEDQPLRLFRRNQSGLPLASFDISAQLDLLADGGEVDIEGATRVGNRIFWISSHGNNSSGELRPNRQRLFATDLSGSGAATTLSVVGSYSGLRDDMVAWDEANGHGLGANFLGLSSSAAEGKAPEDPAGDGWNIEGLALAPDSTTAYVGFRAPLTPSSNRTKALIIPVTNFRTLVNGSLNAATFGAPIELDLGGRGIRSIERNASNQYLIVAGPVAEATGVAPSDFRLFIWSGNPADAPQPQPVNLTALATGGSFEAIVGLPNPLSAAAPVQLLSDNGGTDWYGNGVESKTLTPNFQKFRSELITLPITPLDTTAPSVGIDQADGQADPATSGPIRFSVVFSEEVTGFTAADVTLGGTAPGTLTASVTGSGATYTVSVSGMAGPGTISATVPAGAAQDAAGNLSLASPAGGSTVTFAPSSTPSTRLYLPLVLNPNP